MHLIWRGPVTSLEILSQPYQDGSTVLFSGPVAPGTAFEVDATPQHSLIASWLAFGLIEIRPEETAAEPASRPRKRSTEPSDG